MKTKKYKLQNSSLVNWAGMIQNYLYSISVGDKQFIKVFEGFWKEPPEGMFDAIKNSNYEVKEDHVIITVEVQ